MVQKVNFNNLTGDTLTVGNTVITGTGVTVGGSELAGGAKVYANASVLPTSGLTAGELAFTGNAMFITTGSGWYRIAVVNQDPTITLSESSISLGASGNTVFFTYTTSDPDGTTPTVTLANSGIANTSVANVNLYTANNTVRIDNFSATDWSGTITLTASDGISTAFDSLTVSVGYLSEYWDETALSIDTSSTNSLDNSTFIDRSTNAHTVTPTGSPVQNAFHPYLDYYGVYLNGSSYYSVSMSADWQFNTGDYTAEIWVKPDDTSTGSIFGVWSDTNASNQMWYIQQTSAGFRHWIDPADTIINQSASSAVVPGKWTHIAITRSGDTFRMFIDGTKVSENTSAGYNMNESGGYLTVGRAENGSYFNGYVADAHIIKGYAKYTSDFTLPTEPTTAHANTKFLSLRKNRIYDESSSSHSISINGSPKVVAVNPFGQLSEYATGVNKGSFIAKNNANYVAAPIDAAFAFGTGDCTIEAWVYPLSFPNTWNTVVCNFRDDETQKGWQWLVSSTGLIHTNFQGTWGNTTTALPLKTWSHVAITRSSGSVKRWINGVNAGGDFTANVNVTNNTAHGPVIGYAPEYSNRGFDGYITDVRVTAGTARYTSTFTPPTSPVGNTDADLYVPMDNAGIYDKTGNHTLALSGDTATSTTQTKYELTSTFRDTGGILINDVSSMLSSDFTYEGWFYPTESPGNGNALISHGWGAGYGCFVFYSGVSAYSLYASSTGSSWDLIGGENINVTPWTNSWKHFAFTRSGNVVRVFLDGTQTYTKTISGAFQTLTAGTNDIVSVGSSITGTSGVHGAFYVENFQILKGVAKYTSNFTPPTETQGRTYQATS